MADFSLNALSVPPWMMAKMFWSVPMPLAWFALWYEIDSLAHRVVRSMLALMRSCLAGRAMRSSSIIMMSEPRLFCMSMTFLGVK